MKEYLDVLKKYATFSGRARRREYWMFMLINTLIMVGLSLVSAMLDFLMIVAVLYILATLIPNLAVTVRRLQDTGRSGWWIFISLVPFVGSIILIVFMCLDSAEGDNKYGPNPKGITASVAPTMPVAPPVQTPVAPAPAPAPAPAAEASVATVDAPPQA